MNKIQNTTATLDRTRKYNRSYFGILYIYLVYNILYIFYFILFKPTKTYYRLYSHIFFFLGGVRGGKKTSVRRAKALKFRVLYCTHIFFFLGGSEGGKKDCQLEGLNH